MREIVFQCRTVTWARYPALKSFDCRCVVLRNIFRNFFCISIGYEVGRPAAEVIMAENSFLNHVIRMIIGIMVSHDTVFEL